MCVFLAENKFIYLVFTVGKYVCEILPNKMKCWMGGWILFYLLLYFWQQFFSHLLHQQNHYSNVPKPINQTSTSSEKSANLQFSLHFTNFIDLHSLPCLCWMSSLSNLLAYGNVLPGLLCYVIGSVFCIFCVCYNVWR